MNDLSDQLRTIAAREEHIAHNSAESAKQRREASDTIAAKNSTQRLDLSELASAELSQTPSLELLGAILTKLLEHPAPIESLTIPLSSSSQQEWANFFFKTVDPRGFRQGGNFILPSFTNDRSFIGPLVEVLRSINGDAELYIGINSRGEPQFSLNAEESFRLQGVDHEISSVHLNNNAPNLPIIFTYLAEKPNGELCCQLLRIKEEGGFAAISCADESVYLQASVLSSNHILAHLMESGSTRLFRPNGEQVTIESCNQFPGYYVDRNKSPLIRFRPDDERHESALARDGVVVGHSYPNSVERFIWANPIRLELIRYPEGFFQEASGVNERAAGYVDSLDAKSVLIQSDFERDSFRKTSKRVCVIDLETNAPIAVGGALFLDDHRAAYSTADSNSGIHLFKRAQDSQLRPFMKGENEQWNPMVYDRCISTGEGVALRDETTEKWIIKSAITGERTKSLRDSSGNTFSEYDDIPFTNLPTISGNSHESYVAQLGTGSEAKYIIALNGKLVEHDDSAFFDEVYTCGSGGYQSEAIFVRKGSQWYKTSWYYTTSPFVECERPN